MNLWPGNARWIFLILLLIVAGLRFWFTRPLNYQSGDRIKISFVITDPRLIRYKNIWIKNYRSEVYYGEHLEAIGTLETRVTGNKTNGYWLIYEDIHITPAKYGLNEQINTIRQTAISRLVSYMPAPEGALAAGIFLGGTEKMSQAQKLAFRNTGLTHVVAASGYNVALVVGWAGFTLSRLLGRRLMLPVVILVALLYMSLAGMTAAVVRAGIMSILALIGMYFGRQSDARWALVLTALGMIIWNPDYLNDIGWQLSIAATSGLVLFSPRGDWWTTIAAQITTMPLILHHFGNLSVIAPLANIMVLALMPLAIQITALSLCLGMILPVAGQYTSWLAWPLLKFTNEIAAVLANLPFSNLSVRPMSWFWVAAYYLCLIILVNLISRHSKK
jgi:ComEC/Rec2-related protein